MLARYTYCLSAIVAALPVIASPERVSSLNENVPKNGLGDLAFAKLVRIGGMRLRGSPLRAVTFPAAEKSCGG